MTSAAERARAFLHRGHAAACDVVRPWAHGTIVRATAYADFWDLNVVRVEDEPGLEVDELVAFADEALAGLAHRRLDFEVAAAGERRRAELQARGWQATRILWMRHERPLPPGDALPVEEVAYDDVAELRRAWHREDFPDVALGALHEQQRAVAQRRDARVLAVREGGRPVAFAQLERDGESAEITHAYVAPRLRGAGRGTALTRAAIEAAGTRGDLWITADDDDRPKELYARLGFRPAWTTLEFTRLPD